MSRGHYWFIHQTTILRDKPIMKDNQKKNWLFLSTIYISYRNET